MAATESEVIVRHPRHHTLMGFWQNLVTAMIFAHALLRGSLKDSGTDFNTLTSSHPGFTVLLSESGTPTHRVRVPQEPIANRRSG